MSTNDDDDYRRKQFRDDQSNKEFNRNQDRRTEDFNQDLKRKRKAREDENRRVQEALRVGDMVSAFGWAGMEVPAGSGGSPRSVPNPIRNPEIKAEELKREMRGVLDHFESLGKEETRNLRRVLEAMYMKRIEECVRAQLKEIEGEERDLAWRKLPYDPLGVQREVHHQKQQELDEKKQEIHRELEEMDKRRQQLSQRAGK